MFKKVLVQFIKWRKTHVTDRQLIIALSLIIGLLVGFAAVVIKELVLLIHSLVEQVVSNKHGSLYIFSPIVGLTLTVLFIKYINRKPVRHGIPGVLYSISRSKSLMEPHNLYSSIISSALTVGFGGSVGLEGPTVATGAAIGSNLGQLLGLSQKQRTALLGCACAAAMAAIFKAPIAAVVFVLEVIMIDLTMSAIVPLILSSAVAVLTSYFFLGQNYLYSFSVTESFHMNRMPWYLLFGVFSGLVAAYFSLVYNMVTQGFEKIHNPFVRMTTGGTLLGIAIFLVPSLFGEGYEVINLSLRGQYDYLYDNTFYAGFQNQYFAILILFLVIMLLKAFATSLTFGSGGVGGVFAPSLFTGAIAGLFFSQVLTNFGVEINPANFALLGMAGMIAAVIHAPLTAIFLIAELTGGYRLFVPLMVVATTSYATSRLFVKNSVYTTQLAKRGELMTHHKDKAVLMMIEIKELIETDFDLLRPSSPMKELIECIRWTHRNIFPVVEEDGTFRGIIKLDDIRHIMFDDELYSNVFVRDLMFMPEHIIFANDTMEDVARKFQESGRYNIVVLSHGKYLGFISRASLFSRYRSLIQDFSED
jgi:chloride channel protein, CIC family